jgi:hypothetical protein
VTDAGGNGHVRRGPDGALDDGAALPGEPDETGEAALEALDAQPLDAEEAAAGAAAASDAVDESLDERVESVIDALGGVERTREGTSVAYALAGQVFARLGDDRLEAALDATVLTAALRTPDTSGGSAPGWITFAPRVVDRYARDRAEAWVRLAHRRAAGR